MECPEAGYFVHQGKKVWLMVDGGAAGPDYLMAHAHADIFSYELAIAGQPFVVDSGVYEYAAGPMRQYVRGTEAHNTVQVDGADQIECWSSFRVARRAAPQEVSWRAGPRGPVFEGQFDGYRKMLGHDISHRRRIEVDTEARRVRIADRVTGRGTHCVESRVHLHPEVDILRDGHAFYLSHGDTECRVRVEHGDVNQGRGWYCPQFGVRYRNPVLRVSKTAPLPVRLAYTIAY
jgi:uncharacterized heparinase superfamily protein